MDYHSGELQSASRLRPFRWLQRRCPTHTDPQEGHTAKYPTLTYSDETGFAEQQDLMIKALGPSPEAVVARSGKILEATPRRAQRRPLGPHDATGAQTITDGSFVRIEGDDAAAPGQGSSRGLCPAIAVVASRLPDMCE